MGELRRIDIIRILMEYIDDELVISNIGIPSKELYHVKDREKNFYMLGSMGLASSIGLGLATSTEQKVVVIDGDGSVLMNMGSLSTIGHVKPKNLVLLIVDNSAYGSTGNQPTHTNKVIISKIAEGCELDAVEVRSEDELREAIKKSLREDGTKVIVAKATAYNEKVKNIDINPVVIKHRFMNALNSDKNKN
ncbi:MAG: sulfopyruvate decarboxylase subunit beta [Methanothermococcus sp.]|uniref:sulfopyruvate decarboxylase subunit beta n=1 Tax=Methanothermococcus TaxID=155862 RepID=UPI000379BC34|nr:MULTISPECIES: sulfopyruvate decarboxylase subunit beta [Methanothermococcus]MDK2790282.1 sulfopyruvate decarboxylase subunit beta [Methanothermococcus sp.]MDK2987788.1 sulfopyruvate decarboxylase subunit beta [Methanothermococcus sp.]